MAPTFDTASQCLFLFTTDILKTFNQEKHFSKTQFGDLKLLENQIAQWTHAFP